MKKEKGITLIALIVSIIVMLILVVVTIDIVFEGGLIDKAKQAKEDTDLAAKNDTNMINEAGNKIANIIEGNTFGGFTGNIVQPTTLYVPVEGEIISEIFINPTPTQPNYLFSSLGINGSLNTTFKNGDTKFIVYVSNSYETSEDDTQYFLVQTLNEVTEEYSLYIRVWKSGTFDLYDMGLTEYENGWNKASESEIGEIEMEAISDNKIPSFKGNYILDINDSSYSQHVGNYINNESYFSQD